MEATSELLQKLQRRRERMGERSPLKDINSNTEVASRTKDLETGRVQQRRTVFEGIENQLVHWNAKPGKLDLGRWEQTTQKDSPTQQGNPQGFQASHLDGPIVSSTEDFAIAEDPIDSTTSSTNTVCNDASGVSVVAPPSGCGCIVKVDGDENFKPVHGMQLSPFPFSGYSFAQLETQHDQCTIPTSPLVQEMQLCPFPSSKCRVVALETTASMPAQSKGAMNILSMGASLSSIDTDSLSRTARSFPTIAPVSPEDPLQYIEDSGVQSQASSFSRKCNLPGHYLASMSEGRTFSTQILRPLQDWGATLRQSDSCVFNHLAEGDSATPSPIKNSIDSGITQVTDKNMSNKEFSDRDGSSPGWEDCPEPLEYFLLDYHGVLPEGLVDKIRSNIEMHAAYVQKLKRKNEKLRRLACHRAPEGCQDVHDKIVATNDFVPQASFEKKDLPVAREMASVTKEPVDSSINIAVVASATCSQASHSWLGCAAPPRALPLYGGGMESEFARTEARVAELEAAIRREGQKLREKDAERIAVFREVEAIRCEARAHRAKLNKHMQGTASHKSM